MKNRDKVQATLIKLGAMCDDCLSAAAMVKPRQTVNIICRELERERRLIRSRDACPRCGGQKIVNRDHEYSKSLEVQDRRFTRTPENKKKPIQAPAGRKKNHDVAALSEDEIKEVLVGWLAADGWQTNVAWGRTTGIDVDAYRGRERWIIEVKGPGSRQPMRVNYFVGILGETLQRMSDPKARYSIALPDLPQYRGLWSRLPALAKDRTRISVLFVSIDGTVQHDQETVTS